MKNKNYEQDSLTLFVYKVLIVLSHTCCILTLSLQTFFRPSDCAREENTEQIITLPTQGTVDCRHNTQVTKCCYNTQLTVQDTTDDVQNTEQTILKNSCATQNRRYTTRKEGTQSEQRYRICSDESRQ
jgi:hypothetical protein